MPWDIIFFLDQNIIVSKHWLKNWGQATLNVHITWGCLVYIVVNKYVTK